MSAMQWAGWGDPAKATTVPPQILALLQQTLGLSPRGRSAPALDAVPLPEPTINRSVLDELASIVGAEHVRTGAHDRLNHTRGKSTVDLLRVRAADADDAPDAVILPASHDEVVAVLQACERHRVVVVPFGGGTSAVGGLAPTRAGFSAVVALDLARMHRLLGVDPASRIATLEAGVRAPDAEQLLGAHGFTLGHFPQSFEYASIGGFAATRSSGQYSAGYGRFDEMVMGLRIATPAGTVRLGRAPRSAAGPDLRHLFLGSEGAFGVITEVTVRVRPTPEERVCEGWSLPSFADGVMALRRLAQDGPLPTLLRLSDEYETAVNAAAGLTSQAPGGCLAIVGYENAAPHRADTEAVLREAGGTPLGPGPGEVWLRGRFAAPYLRDALLDAGALVETVETATFWSGLDGLYRAVRDALMSSLADQGTPPLVLCHVSHLYAEGASLYFTVACAQSENPIAQWQRAKEATNAAIHKAGGTITHHHGVGVDHAAGLIEEIGPLAIDALRAVKARLDPAGILNPGILLPAASAAHVPAKDQHGADSDQR
jgi:alkyldihydroxyacetonephosphate synthase